MQSQPALAPQTESLIHTPKSYFETLDLDELFPVIRPLELELGSGDGSFLVDYARANPDRNFLGVERLLGRLRKIDRKGRRAGVDNLRAIRVEASYLLEYMLPPESACALHIYFPDPWPKRKHLRKRLINERFTALARRVLKDAGQIHMRTDDAHYFQQMNSVFESQPGFRVIEPAPALVAVLTDFERDFLAKGVTTLRLSLERSSSTDSAHPGLRRRDGGTANERG
jgi:tRNA (guanine-N7-)-methyltransferase